MIKNFKTKFNNFFSFYENIERKSVIWILVVLFFWFNYIGVVIYPYIFRWVDFIFKTNFLKSGIAYNIFVFLSSLFWIFLILFFDKKWKLKWKFKLNYKIFITIIIGLYMAAFLEIIASYLVSMFRENTIPQNQKVIDVYKKTSQFGLFFLSVILAPIVEEFLFRFSIINIFSNIKNGSFLGIILSSLYFGYVHIDTALATGQWHELFWLIYYGGCGLVFAFAYYIHRNILVAILLHFLINLGSFI